MNTTKYRGSTVSQLRHVAALENAAKAIEGKAESERESQEGQICSVMVFALGDIELLRFTPAANPVD